MKHTPTNTHGLAFANDILSGKLPRVEFETYSETSWRWAAEDALESGDYSELLAMRDEEIQNDLDEQAERRAEYSGNPRRSWLAPRHPISERTRESIRESIRRDGFSPKVLEQMKEAGRG